MIEAPFERLASLLESLIIAIRGRIDEVFTLMTSFVAAITKISDAPSIIVTKLDHSVSTICWTTAGVVLTSIVLHHVFAWMRGVHA